MNRLFTLKARVILVSLLICQLSLKAAQFASEKSSSHKLEKKITKVADTTLAKKTAADTTPDKKAGNAEVLKTDTTLIVKSGNTMVKLVITTKGNGGADANGQKAGDAASLKVDSTIAPYNNGAASSATDANSKQDASAATAKTDDSNNNINKDNSATAAGATASDASAASNAAAGVTGSASATTNNNDASAGNKQSNASASDANTQTATAGIQQGDAAASGANTQAANQVAKADTNSVKKADTLLAKKSDTTLMRVDTSSSNLVKAQNLFLEIGGAGLAISANYDARFHKERAGWGYRVGVGYFGAGGNTVFTVPFQVNYLWGSKSSFLELGAGTTFLNSTGTNQGNSKWEFDKVTGFIGTATIGYRYQPRAKGLNFRIAFVPILYDEGLIPAGGVSVGYTFK
ncbi:MAG: hypothetical protein ACTHJ8_09485 [Mucilaginibacter sp.]